MHRHHGRGLRRPIHHELGHNYYQRAYDKQPVLFRDSANDGFHEAIGDTIALSVTPEYLVKLGLLDKAPDASKDIGLLLQKALEKVAFLPFGLLIDQWRWKVFSGEITPADYNKAWWELRLKYQGIAPPIAAQRATTSIRARSTTCRRAFRTRATSSPTSCSSSSTARSRRPRAARGRSTAARSTETRRRASGCATCSRWGSSRPWPDALEALTGQRQMDATAIRDYFAPLQKWLDEQNKGKPIGW